MSAGWHGRRYWDEKVETLPRRELLLLQDRRIRGIIRYVWSNSAFYRRRMRRLGLHPSDFRGRQDLSKIPVTRKEELRRSQGNCLAKGLRPYEELLCVPHRLVATSIATSGTTGTPVVVPLTEHDCSMYHGGDLCQRGFVAAGVMPGEIIQNAFNYSFWFVCGSTLEFGGGMPYAPSVMLISHVGNTPLQIEAMRRLGVTVFSATPSYAINVIERASEDGFEPGRDLKVNKLLLAGEPGGSIPAVRQRIERLWRAKAYDIMGMVEVGWTGGECLRQAGLHLAEDFYFYEFLDPSTEEPVSAGEEGKMIITHLDREAMPLVRYDTCDVARLNEEVCACGRTHARIGGLIGRTDEMLKVKGLAIYPSALSQSVSRKHGCTGRFLVIVQKDQKEILDTCVVKVEYEKGRRDLEDLRESLVKDLQAVMSITPDVQLVPSGRLSKFALKSVNVLDLRKPYAYERYKADAEIQSLLD